MIAVIASGATTDRVALQALGEGQYAANYTMDRSGNYLISITATGSSVDKGESLLDTVNTLAAMRPDAIVMRHAASGAPHFLARALAASNVATPIINAGDGTHEHPTQGLLDALTILDHKPQLQGLRVAIIGDISNSRVARSNIHLLTKFGANVVLCGPPPMLSRNFELFSPLVKRTNRMEEAIAKADVIMMLRVQLERGGKGLFASDNEYFRYFGLRLEHLQIAQPDAIVMHPGPINRGRELSSDVADFPRSAILNQVENGIAVRMAVLDLLLAEGKNS